jgi:hypothetical protein
MRFLRKILLAIGILLILAGLKIFFKKHFPDSLFFHFNLISCLQLIVLSWAVITGLLEIIVWKDLPRSRARRNSFFIFLVLLFLAESGSYWMLHHPASIPRPMLTVARYYYSNYQRDILQYNTTITQYDSALFYRMKSNNRSLFSNIEFSDSIFTDTHGFRDDTHALDHPLIICLGDSYTLGWGVHQQEAYPSLLRQMLKVPVLNTGMSSYGTAREIASIRSIDKSALRTVVIQYCPNDAGENEAYVNNNYKPLISPPSSYDSARNVLQWSNTWFPGKYICTQFKLLLSLQLLPRAQKVLLSTPAPAGNSEQYDKEAGWFLEVLKRSDLNFDSTNVFVFEICEYQQLSGDFINALKKKLADPGINSIFKDHIHTLHIEKLFTPADYYILDEHIRPSGHLKLARLLADSILNSKS